MAQNTKEHYLILDGLRGIAALMVVLYHLFEAVAFAEGASEQHMYHGFLAVDFFLILSGFVMGYAYDSRWDKMSVGGFFRRRLIRLHPMVVMGVAIGLACFLCQGGLKWDGTPASGWAIALSTLLALFLIPSPLGLDVRGNTEMFPLNGPHWSLFFEYIGSILYALLIRRMSTKWLKVWVACAALALLAMGLFGPDGSIAYGWSSQPVNMLGGLLRMAFAYPAGLLLARMFKDGKSFKYPAINFAGCIAALVLTLSVPSFTAMGHPQLRVWFELFAVAFMFPAIIWLGAHGKIEKPFGVKPLTFLGDLSYPLYAIHYPFIYLYIGWINEGKQPFGPYWWSTPLALSIICIVLATLLAKFYDKPVRKWLSGKK